MSEVSGFTYNPMRFCFPSCPPTWCIYKEKSIGGFCGPLSTTLASAQSRVSHSKWGASSKVWCDWMRDTTQYRTNTVIFLTYWKFQGESRRWLFQVRMCLFTGEICDWVCSQVFETSKDKPVFICGNQVYLTGNIRSLYGSSYLKGHFYGVWNFQRENIVRSWPSTRVAR